MILPNTAYTSQNELQKDPESANLRQSRSYCVCRAVRKSKKNHDGDFRRKGKSTKKPRRSVVLLTYCFQSHYFTASQVQCSQTKLWPYPQHQNVIRKKQWRRQLVGTWARAPPLAFERIFSLGYTLKQVWFGLVLCQTLINSALFAQPYSLL